jgi:membrane-associated protease RseP (regulator of RpoE activity)
MSSATPVNDATATTVMVELMEEGRVENEINVSAVSVSGAPEATATAIIETYTESTGPEAVGDDHIVSVTAQPIVTASNTVSNEPSPLTGGRAEFLSITFLKKTADAHLGVELREQANGSKYLSKIKAAGPFAQSPLRVGDKILSINNKSCVDFTDRGAAAELLQQLVGTVTIVAQNVGGDPKLVETMIEKRHAGSVVGIGVRRNARGSLEVSKVSADGLFAHSLVNIGDRVLSINHIGCNQMDPVAALDIVRSGSRYITLLTETQHETAMVLAAASDHPGAFELETAVATGIMGRRDLNQRESGACFCVWMIILSLSFMSIVVYRRV